MTTLTIRPSRGEEDCLALVAKPGATSAKLFADIADLVNLNESHGQLDEDTLACDLQRFIDAPNVDIARDFRFWKDTSGKLIGFGLLLMPEQNNEIEGYLYFDVHPTRHGDALGTEILQWSEQRLREVGKQWAMPVKLRTRSRDHNMERRRLLEKQGFTTERCFLTMTCSLVKTFSSSKLPTGFTWRSLLGSRHEHSSLQDIKAWVELFNESFIDHWDHHDLTVAMVRQWLKNPHYKPELNLIAVAPNSRLAAFCVGYINLEENARKGRNESWIKLLGTRRGFRKLGLGRAMLLACMQQLKAEGVEQVNLGVDAQSLTSATQLYQSVGFQAVSTWLSYAKAL